jgi:RNA polymerase sigma-70 factor (ECF subfamily)
MARQSTVETLHEHVVSLRRFALVLTRNRDDAEDLVQETLTRAIAAIDSYQPDTDLRAWLFRIMNNAHISTVRKRQVRDAASAALPDAAIEATQSLRVEVRQVLAALDELPESQREAILLMALEDMKYKDAAQILNVPLGTFMSRIARGREALRRAMEGVKSVRLRVIGGRQ